MAHQQLLQIVEIDTPAFPVTSPMGADKTWRFAVPVDYLPAELDAIASVATIRYDPATISLGENLGQRASLTITFRDHLHVMNGESFDAGTFWGKWRGRYGQKLRGRAVRLIRGFEGQALEDMETRHFFIETTDGPTPAGLYTIVAKDLLKFADDNRSQAPALSNGRLAGSIDNSTTAATLSPTGIGDLEYPASGHLCFGGKEIVSFTRSGDSLTIVRAQLGTLAIAHNAGDRAQLVLYYDGDDVADIIQDLLVNYAAIDSSYIPLTEWQGETAANLGVIYARAITEPTSVAKLVGELVEQAALAVWWDDRGQVVRLQVLREIATDAAVFDEDVILADSLAVKDQPDKRISQIWTYFGQRNPADRGDDEDNYRAALADVDLALQTEYGGPIIRKIIGKWVATENAAQRLNQVQLSRFRDPPRKFNFDLFHGTAITPGGGYRLRWRQNQDETGAIVDDGAPIQITRVAVEDGVIHVEAEEMLASGVVVLTNVVILTTTGGVLNWTVPADWNDADNEIHCIGAGGGGSAGQTGDEGKGGGAGGGGAYSRITNLDLTPAGSVQYRVGSGGAGSTSFGSPGGTGGDTWFNGATLGASSVGAKGGGGASGQSGGSAGASGSGVGTLKSSGGAGGSGYTAGSTAAGGAGGGGAAGPNGNGAAGGGNAFTDRDGGAGGGAANGGSAGQTTPTNPNGGTGGNNRFNFGGGTGGTDGNVPTAGLEGAGGGGGYQNQHNGAAGGSGEQLWTQTVAPIISAGPGGGAGGGGARLPGGPGGLYGGGGGGGGDQSGSAFGGAGAQGCIVIIWTPA